MDNTQNNQENNQNKNKVNAEFDKVMKKVAVIVGGEKNLKPKTKISTNILETIVTDLFKEEKEQVEAEVKKDLKALLVGHVDLKKAIEAKKKELAELETKKKKEFNETAKKLFNKIEGLDVKEKEYYEALTAAGDSAKGENSEPKE